MNFYMENLNSKLKFKLATTGGGSRLFTNNETLINNSIKWPGLNGLDLAKEVSTKKTYTWKGFKT